MTRHCQNRFFGVYLYSYEKSTFGPTFSSSPPTAFWQYGRGRKYFYCWGAGIDPPQLADPPDTTYQSGSTSVH